MSIIISPAQSRKTFQPQPAGADLAVLKRDGEGVGVKLRKAQFTGQRHLFTLILIKGAQARRKIRFFKVVVSTTQRQVLLNIQNNTQNSSVGGYQY